MNNQVISNARGECRHKWESIAVSQNTLEIEFECKVCHKRQAIPNDGALPCCPTNYDSAPSAWSPELFQWIEDEGLYILFTQKLYDTVSAKYPTCPSHVKAHNYSQWLDFKMITASPQIKAQALASTIKERS
jgi:hypothetical protein